MKTAKKKLLWPKRGSPNWECSECAWSQPSVQRLALTPRVPAQAIDDSFNEHRCEQYPRQKKKPREDFSQTAARIVREATEQE
jgi:hypothetical protein